MEKSILLALHLLLLFLLMLLVFSPEALSFTRDDFPQDFVFGAGTSAYQYEGAANEDGRSPSIWDTFAHAGYVPGKTTGDVAVDGYHKYKEDIRLMSDMNLEAYRFSISWSRLIPNGRGAVNLKGLEFYNNVIDELVTQGIQIHITLFHLDFPQVLEDEYKGWLSPRVVEDFTAYADVCFREFGDRVSHWTTLDEPNVITIAEYDSGAFPPNHCSPPFAYFNCTEGNSTVEPYIAAHNLILAHASVVKLYREKYQATQKGFVGVNLYTYWSYPFTESEVDIAAAKRTLDFMIGWFLDPLVYGDYPEIMKKIAAPRIPSFTKEESELVRGATDFLGINHYTSVYIADNSSGLDTELRDYNADMLALFSLSRNDTPTSSAFLPFDIPTDPEGLQHVLEYFRDAYGNLPVYVQENGFGKKFEDEIQDTERADYLKSYMESTLTAVRNGANVKGYFVWSFMDLFELLGGQLRYGLYYVDLEDVELKRQPKMSARWYSSFLRNKGDKDRIFQS